MAAKAKVASTAKKAKAGKATGKARGRPRGLQLSAAQAKAYNKAFSATARKLGQAAKVRAFATGLRKYRLQAANNTVKAYGRARATAQAAAVASHASSQSLMQSKAGHQNLALQARIGAAAFRHATLLGRAQFAQAGVKAYAHSAVMRTVTQKQAVNIETKFLSKVLKNARKAAKTGRRPTGTPLSKAITAAAKAAGNAAAAKAKGGAAPSGRGRGRPKGTARAGTAKTKVVAANAKASAKAAAASKKAPAKVAKTRTAPNFAAQAAAYAHMSGYAGMSTKPPKVVTTSRQEWVGDEITPNCIVTAVANSILRVKSVIVSEKELKELTEMAGPEPTIEEVLWQVYLTGWPGHSAHLTNYREVGEWREEEEGLVIGFEVNTDDGWKDHCSLSLADNRVISWGEEQDRESLVEEAWELTWQGLSYSYPYF